MQHSWPPEPELEYLEREIGKIQKALDEASLGLARALTQQMREELTGLRRKNREDRVAHRAAELCEQWRQLDHASRNERLRNATPLELLVVNAYFFSGLLNQTLKKLAHLKTRH